MNVTEMTGAEYRTWCDARWTNAGQPPRHVEVQVLPDGQFDVVTVRLAPVLYDHDAPRPYRIDRWWHAEQCGYWYNLEAAIEHAELFKLDHLVVRDIRAGLLMGDD